MYTIESRSILMKVTAIGFFVITINLLVNLIQILLLQLHHYELIYTIVSFKKYKETNLESLTVSKYVDSRWDALCRRK